MRAPPAAVAAVRAAAPAVSPARVVRLAVVAAAALVARQPVAVQPGEDGREEEEDGVHDAQGEGGLEQRTGLVRINADPVARELAKDAKVDVVLRAVCDVCAVGVGDEA